MGHKITSKELLVARYAMDAMKDTDKLPVDMIEAIELGGHDPDVIQHIINRMKDEGVLQEEAHRFQAKDRYAAWAPNNSDNMANEIVNEFIVKDGKVDITPEELLDIIAYVADEYYG